MLIYHSFILRALHLLLTLCITLELLTGALFPDLPLSLPTMESSYILFIHLATGAAITIIINIIALFILSKFFLNLLFFKTYNTPEHGSWRIAIDWLLYFFSFLMVLTGAVIAIHANFTAQLNANSVPLGFNIIFFKEIHIFISKLTIFTVFTQILIYFFVRHKNK